MRKFIVKAALAAMTVLSALAIVPAVAGAASASTSCSHTVTHAYSRTALGTQSWTAITKDACGRNYNEWETRVTHSYTGASSVEHLSKDMYSYPHYHETVELQSWTARGTYSIRWTHKSA